MHYVDETELESAPPPTIPIQRATINQVRKWERAVKAVRALNLRHEHNKAVYVKKNEEVWDEPDGLNKHLRMLLLV